MREFLTWALWPEMVLAATVLGILAGICGGEIRGGAVDLRPFEARIRAA
jgi:hypothetical protein